jgi:hypothetical protein
VGPPRSTKCTVILRAHEDEHPRHRGRTVGSGSPRTPLRARGQGARGLGSSSSRIWPRSIAARPSTPPRASGPSSVIAPRPFGCRKTRPITVSRPPGPATHEKLRRVQALLRREIPDGDPGAIFDRALTLLLDRVERTKLAAAAKPRLRPSIRAGTDESIRSRDIPRAVKRAAWRRDTGQCAFVSPTGRRCSKRTFLNSTTFSLMRNRGRPPSRTSPFAAGATTSTRPS